MYILNSQILRYIDIQNIINQQPTTFIILGDFNSHNILWGCKDTDQRGTIIEKILENNNKINILNNNQPTRISDGTGNLSAIDLSLCSSTISPHFEWNTIESQSSLVVTISNQTNLQVYLPRWTTYSQS